jgi:hypothetical protein
MGRYKEGLTIRYWRSKFHSLWFFEVMDKEEVTRTIFAYDDTKEDVMEEIATEYGNLRKTELEKCPHKVKR